MDFHGRTMAALQADVALEQITSAPVVAEIARIKEITVDKAVKEIQALMKRVELFFAELGVE
jgi:hypothetical protein